MAEGRPGMEGMFDRFDKDNDGKLSKDEMPPPMAERLVMADTDEDGAISKDELQAAFRKLRGDMAQRPKQGQPGPGRRGPLAQGRPGPRGTAGRDAPRTRIAAILKRLDENKDGKLTESEVPDGMWARIGRLDANKDGSVTKAEFQQAMPKRGPGPRATKPAGPGKRGAARRQKEGAPGRTAEKKKPGEQAKKKAEKKKSAKPKREEAKSKKKAEKKKPEKEDSDED
jgi:Ca2+-binding EF-hand superfamily protein